ncbi:MAG: methylated-DNA--[protein]-cysteine S-methyltransferase [Candidatus Bathyarchaeota archaeon]|nr:methylated-DNA--[protein]-cysteine S-methyltransferase [Candidatus Bathyarchaeota archaeon]
MIEVFSQNHNGTWFAVAICQQEILATSFGKTQEDTLQKLLDNLPFNEPFQVHSEPSSFAQKTIHQMSDALEGKQNSPSLPFCFSHLPQYTQKVLKATQQIPLGYVASYGGLAKAVGGGARAVGNVMASNPFAPLVPCHRVVKSDLSLGGYGGGLKVKIELLQQETQGFLEPKTVSVDGGVLMVYPVEQVLTRLAML